ncbi:uncharacterized protein PV07_09760 [Cladophialophora immunda]|uniref:Cytochrome b561 domain-containing protein n=1 Tax=Cladophialophora immunda TaxID=569365 RepID=A0A0D1Z8S3_9EURO|nr:uncharacterized protein PV07_09760 [Cladophialophora immunda]KIW24021.1 hypothetical protein PV07_09760 [Cladophialophora immunda]OQV01845.1 DOMON domain-containing protein [Cladophialophora immunda]
MKMLTRLVAYSGLLSSFAAYSFAKQAQFYEKSENFGFAISSTGNNGNAAAEEFNMQISAPTSYGWAAVGTGDRMHDSLMFIIYPSGQGNGVTLSVRTSSGHDTPEPVSGVNATVLNSEVENGKMTATIQWYQSSSHKFNKVDVTRTKQSWIWAVGPNEQVQSNSIDAEIDQHSHYGVFFVDMTATQNAVATVPSISGTSSVSAEGQPDYYHGLVYAHAILLGVAFVIVFPVGVLGLRWRWSIAFKVHWMLQLFATVGAYLGLAVAIALSITGVEYSAFDETHQILGICVVAVLSFQVVMGYIHHLNYKKVGRRTVPSHFHIWLGRVLIYAGMVNAILGALLSDDTGIAIAVGIVSAVLALGLEFMAFRHRRQYSRVGDSSKNSSNIALNSFQE